MLLHAYIGVRLRVCTPSAMGGFIKVTCGDTTNSMGVYMDEECNSPILSTNFANGACTQLGEFSFQFNCNNYQLPPPPTASPTK
jgi:hypothetical protein